MNHLASAPKQTGLNDGKTHSVLASLLYALLSPILIFLILAIAPSLQNVQRGIGQELSLFLILLGYVLYAVGLYGLVILPAKRQITRWSLWLGLLLALIAWAAVTFLSVPFSTGAFTEWISGRYFPGIQGLAFSYLAYLVIVLLQTRHSSRQG